MKNEELASKKASCKSRLDSLAYASGGTDGSLPELTDSSRTTRTSLRRSRGTTKTSQMAGMESAARNLDRLGVLSEGTATTINRSSATSEMAVGPVFGPPSSRTQRPKSRRSSLQLQMGNVGEVETKMETVERTSGDEIAQVEDNEPSICINTAASILASLDTRSYQRSIVQDANKLVQNVLLPMSIPWMHKVPPVARNIPCDIDEMIAVLTLDDGRFTPFDKGNFGFSQYETGRLRSGSPASYLANSSDMIRSATRASNDPGVIDICTVALPVYELQPPTTRQDVSDLSPPNQDASVIEGETELQCFEIMQALKKRKVEQARQGVQSISLSVKINSCSSRSSIFAKRGETGLPPDVLTLPPHLLEATLPLEVQNGRHLGKAKARIVVNALGSYDLCHGLGDNRSIGENAKRTKVGRTRLMWTKMSSTDQPQRLSFTSLITGGKIEGGRHKRPRDVMVQLKVGGSIFDGGFKGDDIALSETHRSAASPYLQGSLDSRKFVHDVLTRKSPVDAFPSNCESPVLECIPDICGSVHVLCTSPGKMPRLSVNSILNKAARTEGLLCTVCWQSTEGGLEVLECKQCGLLAHMGCCLDKGKTATTTLEEGLDTAQREWVCSLCCFLGTKDGDNLSCRVQKRSKRAFKPSSKLKESQWQPSVLQSTKNDPAFELRQACVVCGHLGGAMSQTRINTTVVWMHEVCRIWTSGVRNVTNSSSCGLQNKMRFFQPCVLCDNGDNSALAANKQDGVDVIKGPKDFASFHCCVVKCAANDCHVNVHPMCALIASVSAQSRIQLQTKGADDQPSPMEKARESDHALCTQYTLSFANVAGTMESCGTNASTKLRETLPVVFCGIHNPKREPSFYGLPPGGHDLEQCLRVPPCIEPAGAGSNSS